MDLSDKRIQAATVCSGIGAPELALSNRYDFQFCAEIEKFPSAVLGHHYPEAPNLGDITQVHWAEWAGKIDLLIGGPPCQSFSVAGDRKSLNDPRGLLTFTYVETLKQVKPALAIYENVYGILSAKQNPWGKLLGCIVGSDEIQPPCGKWRRSGMVAGKHVSVAWRTLNARNFGLAQNRERVYVVICDSRKFGELVGAKPWFDTRRFLSVSGEICFEFLGCDGYSTPKQGTGEKTTSDTGARIEFPPEFADTLGQGHGGGGNRIDGIGAYIPAVGFSKVDGGGDACEERAPTLRAGNFVNSHISGSGNGVSIAHKPSLNWEVRRLTPIECERLMGFSDDYTNIPWRGKPYSPDSLRYKALGNSMAVPCLRYLADSIDEVLKQYRDFFTRSDAFDIYLEGLQIEVKEQMARDRFKSLEGQQLSLF